jgi:Tol biopolymer transport system component
MKREIFYSLFLLFLACHQESSEVIIGRKPVWSPDGSTIAYYKTPYELSDTGGIWLIDTDGTNNRYLCPGLSADWSPDGQRLVVATYGWCIHLIDKDGSNIEWLIEDGQSNSPTWSPDGKWVAFGRPFSGAYLMNLEDNREIELPSMGGLNWSPDSKHIVYFLFENQAYVQKLKIMNIYDSTSWLVKDLSDIGYLHGFPSWSPDGDEILFTSGGIYVIDTSEENLKRLAKSGIEPDWSPDGEWIVYCSYREGEQLYLMKANGRNKHPLVEE